MAVSHRAADGDVGIEPSTIEAVGRNQVGTLRRAVAVEQLHITAHQVCHALTSQRHIPEGQWAALYEQFAQRGGVAAARNAVAGDEIANALDVSAYLRRHDMQATSDGQHGIEILYMSIEREGTMQRDAVCGRKPEDIGDGGYVGGECALPYHHALGTARGA